MDIDSIRVDLGKSDFVSMYVETGRVSVAG